MKARHLTFIALAAGSLIAGALAVAPAAAENDGWWGRGMMGRWFMGEMSDHMRRDFGPGMMMGRGFTDSWTASLKVELAITDAQSKLWNDYVAAVQSATETMRGMHAAMMQGAIPEKLPERLALHETMIAARLESIKSVNAATLALYREMSQDQKAKADDLLSGMGMM